MTEPTPPPLLHGSDDSDPALRREHYGTEVDPARQAPEGPLGTESYESDAAVQPDQAGAGGGFDKPLNLQTADPDAGHAASEEAADRTD